MKPIVRSYLTEVNLGNTTPGAGANINIKDYPQLRDVYVTGFEVFSDNVLTLSPSGKTVVTTLTGITLTLVDIYNMEMVYQYPTYDLNPVNVGGFYRDFNPFQIQITKSFISILNPSGLNQNESVMINFFYVPVKEWNKYASIYVRK
jgi:hypothetical protein